MSFSKDSLTRDSSEFERVDKRGENYEVEIESKNFDLRGLKTRTFGGEPVYRFFWGTDKQVLDYSDFIRSQEFEPTNIEAYVPGEQEDVKIWDNAEMDELAEGSQITIRGEDYRITEITDLLFRSDEYNVGWSFGLESRTEAYFETKKEYDATEFVSDERSELDALEIETVATEVQNDLYRHSFDWLSR